MTDVSKINTGNQCTAPYFNFSYNDLITRFGEVSAWHYLIEIEKASGLRPCQNWGSDPESRLVRALHIQDAALTLPTIRVAA